MHVIFSEVMNYELAFSSFSPLSLYLVPCTFFIYQLLSRLYQLNELNELYEPYRLDDPMTQ